MCSHEQVATPISTLLVSHRLAWLTLLMQCTLLDACWDDPAMLYWNDACGVMIFLRDQGYGHTGPDLGAVYPCKQKWQHLAQVQSHTPRLCCCQCPTGPPRARCLFSSATSSAALWAQHRYFTWLAQLSKGKESKETLHSVDCVRKGIKAVTSSRA